MRVNQLRIVHGDSPIRTIEFKDGLNLILDSPIAETTHSGNNVGKTTVLRLIDYCLGSDGDDIWQDSEFKKNVNQEVYDYLHGSIGVHVSLTLVDEVRGAHRLTRYFVNKKTKLPSMYVDDTGHSSIANYRLAVKQLLFGSVGSKPTLRQLAPKFVRSSQALMSKTLKFLGDYGSEIDYEALHLFLFGFFSVEVLEERPKLAATKKKQSRDLEALVRDRNEGEIEQLLLHLRREVEELGLSNQLTGEVPAIAIRANVVSELRTNAANLAGTLGRLEGEVAAIDMTVNELKSEYSDIDRKTVEAIYREAGKYIPDLQHDWSELMEFIQSLRGRKQAFLETQAAQLRANIAVAKDQLESLQLQEGAEIGALMQSKEFAQALEVRADLQEKLKRLGSLEQDLQDIKNMKAAIALTETRLDETRGAIDDGKAKLQERVGIFNKYFSELSKELYGEQYFLHFDESPRGALSFQLSAVGANVGAGKKVSQTAAFDLAYIEFVKEAGIRFPTFVCHDGVESIHGNQLAALLVEANRIDGQLILATIRDKLPEMPDGFVTRNTILELSQEKKLFLI